MPAEFDHLVVAADTLERGVSHVERCLGIACQAGGHHPDMGTHNALLALGPDRYIEVIAIDPDAGPPASARWFGLDDPRVRATLRERPRLLTWVARTDDLAGTVAAAPHDTGEPRTMRRGDLEWRIAFPADGALMGEGLIPPLIQWPPGSRHPAAGLPDTGTRLDALHGTHPDSERVRTTLAALGLDDALRLEDGSAGEAARLHAEIHTPNGLRWLD